jgi:hypothetical protein
MPFTRDAVKVSTLRFEPLMHAFSPCASTLDGSILLVEAKGNHDEQTYSSSAGNPRSPHSSDTRSWPSTRLGYFGACSTTIERCAAHPARLFVSSSSPVRAPRFDAVGTRVIMGRGIGIQDGPTAPMIAVVNRALVKTFFAPEKIRLAPTSDHLTRRETPDCWRGGGHCLHGCANEEPRDVFRPYTAARRLG